MSITIDALAIVAALCTAVIFGTDVLGALVIRPVYAEIDTPTLVQITGRTHRIAGQRMPIPGVLSVVAAVGTLIATLVAGSPAAAAVAAVGLLCLLVWLLLFNRISLPINKVLIAASEAGETPPNARALQERWDSIITLRATLQGVALVAFCLAIALSAR